MTNKEIFMSKPNTLLTNDRSKSCEETDFKNHNLKQKVNKKTIILSDNRIILTKGIYGIKQEFKENIYIIELYLHRMSNDITLKLGELHYHNTKARDKDLKKLLKYIKNNDK